MSKFGGTDYILVVQDKADGPAAPDKPKVTEHSMQIITNSAMNYALEKNISVERRFSTRDDETTSGFVSVRQLFGDKNAGKFSPLTGQPFSRLTETDKLFIFAHGVHYGIAWMTRTTAIAKGYDPSADNAMQLAKFLRRYGLRRIGLITFKACFVGKGVFLNSFALALAANGIAAGWLKGYKGVAATEFKLGGTGAITFADTGQNAKPYEVIRKSTTDQTILVDDQRLRIVRGPGNIFEGQNFGRNQRYQGVTSNKDQQAFSQESVNEFLEESKFFDD